MSFRCQNCKQPQKEGTAPIKRVVETRNRKDVGRKHHLPSGHAIDMHGIETVREVNLCAGCVPQVEKKLQDASLFLRVLEAEAMEETKERRPGSRFSQPSRLGGLK